MTNELINMLVEALEMATDQSGGECLEMTNYLRFADAPDMPGDGLMVEVLDPQTGESATFNLTVTRS